MIAAGAKSAAISLGAEGLVWQPPESRSVFRTLALKLEVRSAVGSGDASPVDGFDVSYGLTTPNLLEARVNRAMAEAARRTVVVCDSSKFGRRSLSLIIPTSSVHETITDRKISKRDPKALRETRVEVTLV